MHQSASATQLHRAKRVIALGEFACEALISRSAGAVLAVFRRSFYVRFGSHVVCFGPLGLGKGPINVLVDMSDNIVWPGLALAPLQQVLVGGTIVSIAERLLFDFAGAEIWRPPRPPPFSLECMRAELKLLSASALRRSAGGLGATLIGLETLADWPPASNDLLLQAARRPMRDVADWLLRAIQHQDELPPRSLQSLIGLGPGLTPSGDDFICGVAVALHYFHFRDAACKLAEVVIPIAAQGTNFISSQFLQCAAGGQASNALFEALNAIQTGRDLEQRLNVIDAIGHTSGWDTLAGAALVCAALVQSDRQVVGTRC